MKNFTRVLFVVLLKMTIPALLNAQLVVGNGSTSATTSPINSCYGYSYQQMIYLQSSIGVSGTISAIKFKVTSTLPTTATGATPNTPQGAVTSWKIYLGHTTKTAFTNTTDWISTGSMTLVFDGSVTMPSVTDTWMTITLSSPFSYNNVDNLVIAVDENSAGYTCSYTFVSNSSETNRNIYYRSDITNPDPASPPAGTRASTTPQVEFTGLIPPAPSCSSITAPSNGGTNISVSQQLSWAAASGATSYDVYFGTSANPPLAGNVTTTTYNPGTLSFNTLYYWKVVPKNAGGSATGCSEWTFTTTNNINMSTNSFTKCSGNFYDSGGSASAYASSEDFTLTLCPVSSTDKVSVSFSAFSTEASYDGLMIYNGNSTAAPLISSGAAAGLNSITCPAGAYSGTTSPGTVTSTSSDGCLTFRFRSDVTGTSTGWTASVSCVAPPSCIAPVSAAATSVTSNSAQANWDLSTGTFIVEYGPTTTFGTPGTGATAGNANNTVVTATNTNLKVLTGLTSSTPYTYVVRQDCTGSSNGYSTNSSVKTFTTLVACPAPVSAATTSISSSSAQANWDLTTGNFIVEYGPSSTFGTPGTGATAGNANNTVVTATNTNLKLLTGLTSSTPYTYVVRQDCTGSSNGYSANSTTRTFTTLAAPPDCASGTVISCATNTTVSTGTTGGAWDFAGTFPSNSCGFSTPGPEKVFRFTPTSTGSHTLVVNSGGTGGYHDYFYKLASGGCSNTGWTCIDDVPTTGVSGVTFGPLTAGQEYYILVDREDAPGSSGSQTFQITCPAACPAPVSAAATSITYSSAQANWDLSTGTFIVEYGPTATFGTPGTGATAGNANNTVVTATNTNLKVLTGLTGSTPYSYVVRQDCTGSSNGYSANSTTRTFTTLAAPPANDSPVNATELTVGAACAGTPYTTSNATIDAGEPAPLISNGGDWGSTISQSVWFKFQAPASGTVRITSGLGTNTDTQIALYEASDASNYTTFVLLGSDDDASTGLASELVATGLTPGTYYYVQVDGYNTAVGTFCLSVYESLLALTSPSTCTSYPSSTANICTNGASVSGVTGNRWFTFSDEGSSSERKIILGLNPNGQNLGTVTVREITWTSAQTSTNGIGYLPRYFEIASTTAPSSAVTIRLFFTQADLDKLNTLLSSSYTFGDMNVTHYDGTNEDCVQSNNAINVGSLVNPAPTAVQVGSSNYWYLQFQVSSFSEFITHAGSQAVLPLELKSFTGKAESSSNMLQWETLSEKNVQYHIVERSVDGTHWTEVGRKAGQTESHTSLKYELEDRTPPAKAYYRLRSVDSDGQENLSNSIILTRKGDHFAITAAFPSPANDQVTVQFAALTEENVRIAVIDLHGRLVLEQRFDAQNGINEVPVQIGSLQAGVYLVSISNATAEASPVRIVKE